MLLLPCQEEQDLIIADAPSRVIPSSSATLNSGGGELPVIDTQLSNMKPESVVGVVKCSSSQATPTTALRSSCEEDEDNIVTTSSVYATAAANTPSRGGLKKHITPTLIRKRTVSSDIAEKDRSNDNGDKVGCYQISG